MTRYLALVIGLLAGGLAGAADVTLTVNNATPNVNDTIAVTIHASVPAGESFVAANQYLAFDPAQLELTAQAAGSAGVFVPDSRGLAAINATGEVHAGAYTLSGPVSGSLILGVFTFKALAPGVTQVTTAAYAAGTAPFGNLLYRTGGALVVPTTPGPLTITIGGGGGNQPPVIVSAAWADANPVTLPAGTVVHVVASDPDGDALTYTWSKVSGAGTATFATAAATDSGVTFSAAGSYVLRVTVTDGKGGSVASDVSVTVMGNVDPRADVNHDGVVNALDLQIVIANFGKTVGSPGCDARADANADGAVNALDLQIVIANFGQTVP